MPTYQYACTSAPCGHRFELVQKFSDPAATTCPTCGEAVRKVFSAVGVVFKGSGFYRTDSRAGSNGKGSKSSGSAKSEPGSSSSSETSTSSSSNSSSGSSSATTGSGTAGKVAAST